MVAIHEVGFRAKDVSLWPSLPDDLGENTLSDNFAKFTAPAVFKR
jgi:hypothetical protein